ncbi:group protein [Diaporthe amygdali]|uniref:group protein n=1 Tax=Phomopsis amygdali TaxID=1214568 RepID=UPI0022FE519D|nr:group protein [Diaporthe amygdali]KAJ0107502.1 group protein [Diaporthe amygdali]
MDYISISTACFATNNAISKTSPTLRSFIREVREARAELDAVLAELHSLDGVLDILKDDASSFPEPLAKRTPPLLEHCTSIVHQIEGYMHVCNGLGLSARDKKYRWMAIRGDMEKLRLTLEGYKSTLAVVTDLVGLTKTKRENERLSIDSEATQYRETLEHQMSINDDIKNDLTRVMGSMGGLRARLQAEFGSIYAVSDIEKYLDAMQLHATNLGYRLEAERLEARQAPRQARGADREDRHTHSGPSSVGDAPDSAIDMNDGPPSPYRRHSKDEPDSPPDRRLRHDKSLPNLPIVEIDEFIDEIDELGDLPEPSARAPTPPPKAVARSNSIHVSTLSPWGGHLPGLSRPSSVRSVSDYGVLDSEGNPVVPRRMSSLRSLPRSDGDALSTVGSLRGIQPPRSESSFSMYSSAGTVTTTITGGAKAHDPPPIRDERSNNSRPSRRLFGRRSSFSVPGLPTRPATTNNTASGTKAHILNALAGPGNALAIPAARADAASHLPPSPPSPPTARGHRPNPSVDTTVTTATSNSGTKALRPSTAVSSTGASIRSNSSRISSMFRRVSVWSPRITAETPPEEPEPDDIFGVSLKKSMQMAAATVKTHHDGSKGSSRRDFPRCILSCVSFIKENNGIYAPHIFGGEMASGEAMVRVASLKESFSTAPYYGEGNVDWDAYDVYDAAELIVLFLQQLPKPLISETVAKRWIVLSKQATLPGSMGMRLDHCIDFWDEALLGVRGAARSLFKLLLNLWGDVADAADANEMTAERLAARMLNPLMHLPAGKYTTDFMLGLAFLIRKRSEYSVMLRDGRKSKAAF